MTSDRRNLKQNVLGRPPTRKTDLEELPVGYFSLIPEPYTSQDSTRSDPLGLLEDLCFC